MIDLLNEYPLNLTAASTLIPGHPCARTLTRWTTHGIRGVVLESYFIGSRRFTTEQAIQRFIMRVTERRSIETGAACVTAKVGEILSEV
jgi:hypothetical protein